MNARTGVLFVLIAAVTFVVGFTEIKDHKEHFNNTYEREYVLAVFYNPEHISGCTEIVHEALSKLGETEVVRNNKVLVELLDTKLIPFYDNHYDLRGTSAVKLFIRNRMVNMESFDDLLKASKDASDKGDRVALVIENFINSQLGKISIEIPNFEYYAELLAQKQIIGLYSGSRGDNFDRYYHMAKKHIDFDFVHIFDTHLSNTIIGYADKKNTPNTDFFAIIRHKDALNAFDDKQIVKITEFDEKTLTEFFIYERYDKLRAPDQGEKIVNLMFFKYQPLLLFVRGEQTESPNFGTFEEAIRVLPKQFIYSYTDPNSRFSPNYLQLFIMAEELMMPDTLYIIWVLPSSKVKIEPFDRSWSKQNIVEYVFEFHKKNEKTLSTMRSHFYDYKASEQNANDRSEEL